MSTSRGLNTRDIASAATISNRLNLLSTLSAMQVQEEAIRKMVALVWSDNPKFADEFM